MALVINSYTFTALYGIQCSVTEESVLFSCTVQCKVISNMYRQFNKRDGAPIEASLGMIETIHPRPRIIGVCCWVDCKITKH